MGSSIKSIVGSSKYDTIMFNDNNRATFFAPVPHRASYAADWSARQDSMVSEGEEAQEGEVL